jgi:hypothetical protein
MQSYAAFIRTAKQYANQGEAQRLALMMLLLDVEPRKSLWQDNPNKTLSWEALIREEGLCTPALFGDFKRATKIVEVKTFGVYASAAIVKVPTPYRTRVLRSTQEWIDSHKVKPTYQRITKYVAEMKKELGIRTPRSSLQALRAENKRLKDRVVVRDNYITKLQEICRTNKIRFPQGP